MWSHTSSRAWKSFTEISIRLILLLCLYVLYLKFQPRKHFITEVELHPDYKRPRQESRVTMQTVVILIIILPLLIISLEILKRNYSDALQGLLGWNLALIMNAVATEALKLAVGRPRPDFFYRCFPDSKITPDLHCTGDEAFVTDGRKSFPSGHSSFSCCSLGFLMLWLNWKVRARRRNSITAFVTCIIPLIIATVICVTRICDNRHHWQDVLAGSVIGFLIAYLSYYKYCRPLEARDQSRIEVFSSSSRSNSSCSSKHSDVFLGLNRGKTDSHLQ